MHRPTDLADLSTNGGGQTTQQALTGVIQNSKELRVEK